MPQRRSYCWAARPLARDLAVPREPPTRNFRVQGGLKVWGFGGFEVLGLAGRRGGRVEGCGGVGFGAYLLMLCKETVNSVPCMVPPATQAPFALEAQGLFLPPT